MFGSIHGDVTGGCTCVWVCVGVTGGCIHVWVLYVWCEWWLYACVGAYVGM